VCKIARQSFATRRTAGAILRTQQADRVRKIALEAVPGCSASQGDFAHPTKLIQFIQEAGFPE